MDKEIILKEIRRTAEANMGRPLGVRRFERRNRNQKISLAETLARFAEAQREAGFTPNEKNAAL